MATYLKRTSKLFDLSLIRTSDDVNLRDLICPVCRGILIEPVTLPCTHNLCLGCLKGTFEHNSLSCPLCRVRVGSWLRTATKSETLVNSTLWELIRTRFPKEIEAKRKGDEDDIELDSGFTSKKIILSAAGEIRREYEVQLKIAEDEMRQQRESERLANEALIRKIHAEDEKEKFSQLSNNDRTLAKSLAEKNIESNDKESPMKYYTEYGGKNCSKNVENCEKMRMTNLNENSTKSLRLEKKNGDKNEKTEVTMTKRANLSSTMKNRDEKILCCEKIISNQTNVGRNLKHRAVGRYANSSNFTTEATAGCSGTQQIYGTRSKEELHVPIDILSSKKKILGVEICLNQVDTDERIGSAESAGSHDSINQEIHHFKPIKPIARTTLKISQDGRSIDPKLVRVIPIIKRVTNAVPKPPSPTHLKRILGCSWSAFRGKARQNLELLRASQNADLENDASDMRIVDTNFQQSSSSSSSSSKHQKSQLSDTARRLDLATENSYDANKNYSKSINRIINGTRVSKKLILDETCIEPPRTGRIKKIQNITRNIVVAAGRGKKILYKDEKKLRTTDDNCSSSSCSSSENHETTITTKISKNFNDVTIENIAERIKRRKIRQLPENFDIILEPEEEEEEEEESSDTTPEKRKTRRNFGQKIPTKVTENLQKRRRGATSSNVTIINDSSCNSLKNSSHDTSSLNNEEYAVNREISKNLNVDVSTSEREICDITKKNNNDIDVKIIEEQTRMERLIMQEKKDYELATRLQAQFDDMERIAGRTRGSRRAMERVVETNNFDNGRLEINRGKRVKTTRNNSKQRRRPQKHAVK